MKTFLKIQMMLVSVAYLVGCGGPSAATDSSALNSTNSSNINGTLANPTPLIVNPTSLNVSIRQSVQISVQGGVPPYTFTVAGSGFVAYKTGLYQASGSASTDVVTVRDSAGKTGTVTFTVAGGATSGGSTVTATTCTSMLSNAYIAYEDSSYVSGTGLAYATAANIASASDCSTWCGSQGAGYCMWTPNTGSSAVCLAWPKGTTMYSYQSSWATYAGTCQ